MHFKKLAVAKKNVEETQTLENREELLERLVKENDDKLTQL